MKNLIKRLEDLNDFLYFAKVREKRYTENLSNFIQINSEKNIIRAKKNIFFNQKAQFRIRKSMRKLLHNIYNNLLD